MAQAAAAVAGAVGSNVSALTDIIDSIQNSSARKLILELTNCTKSDTFFNPQVYMSMGQVVDPPPPTIRENEKAVFSFCKHDVLLESVYGVITFDVSNSKKRDKAESRLAIMFYMPFRRDLYANEFGFGVYPPDKACDSKLLDAMYDLSDPKTSMKAKATGSEVRFSGKMYIIRGTMSQTANAFMKVEIYNK